MNDVVVLNKKESIALIQIENPPVNALSHAVRQGLMEAVRELSLIHISEPTRLV